MMRLAPAPATVSGLAAAAVSRSGTAKPLTSYKLPHTLGQNSWNLSKTATPCFTARVSNSTTDAKDVVTKKASWGVGQAVYCVMKIACTGVLLYILWCGFFGPPQVFQPFGVAGAGQAAAVGAARDQVVSSAGWGSRIGYHFGVRMAATAMDSFQHVAYLFALVVLVVCYRPPFE